MLGRMLKISEAVRAFDLQCLLLFSLVYKGNNDISTNNISAPWTPDIVLLDSKTISA